MFKKILVANRGEIALRVICACKDLGIRTVAVYSEADRDSLHVRFADEAVCIGPPPAAQSYLNIPQVISAAEVTDTDAIHPGYGFLSENAHFAEVCAESKITFIGPTPEMIRLMGEKDRARQAAQEAGLPTVPGSDGPLQSLDDAHNAARKIGYPVLIKAVAGGGGKGMRVVEREADLPHLMATAENEARVNFGNGALYMEKFITRSRHIEFQVMADQHGNVAQFGERECSIQRRHQKMIEEAPSPALTQDVRDEMGEKVVKAIRSLGYLNAGTLEFLMDEAGELYFIEMNTRIQVEHPVTELVTGLDLVRMQIRMAAGERLDAIVPPKMRFRGHAIECRIVAEDPDTFIPSAGQITAFHPANGPGVRVDTAVYAEAVVTPHYDSMIAKLLTHGQDRSEALARMRRALEMFVIEGIKTSLPLHQKILTDPDFQAGKYNTQFMERFIPTKVSG